MANGLERESGLTMFSDEELSEVSGVKRVGDYVEVTCGCTSHRYGDAVGRLRVFVNGYLEITCECTPGCQEGLSLLSLSITISMKMMTFSFVYVHVDIVCCLLLDKLTPSAFEKHSGRETARKWKNNVWVIVNGEKVPLFKTVLLKYYNQVSRAANGSHRSQNGRACHRDEFVRCTRCDKERRFRLRTKEECRIHHDALADANWKCSDLSYDKITCDDEEERASRRVYRGCTRSPTCKGCTSCVCFGCDTCRFSDCSCQTCTDFTNNAKA
ncbi:protein ULTRAPETALA 1-like isoform X1 [Abrus precatorius]|uniref:Protein ULTRAPETALA 1-like isoform X1 n=1 Tax=Abrus precatorius TaxID=3816 RepID=A0A8B8KXD5_ABRPR|nr:protein ULTRAPETALA 1-like isoform X1 [Abrus precatorius]